MSQTSTRKRQAPPKTSQARRNAMKPSLNFSLPLPASNHGLDSLKTSLPNMALNTSTPDELNLNQGQPLAMNSLMNVISTSNESADVEEEEKQAKKRDRFTRMEEAFIDQLTGIGTNLAMFGADADGIIILSRAQPLAHKITNVARQNPAVYRALKRYLDGSVYAMLAEEMVAITGAICMNHGLNPVEWLKGLFGKKAEGDGNADLSAVA